MGTVWSAGGLKHYDRNRSAKARGVGNNSSSAASVSTVQWFAREAHHQIQRGNTAASRCTAPHNSNNNNNSNLKKSPQIEWRMCGTYLVFMPSSIFEFRRAVHDSPSVIYHHTKNRRIESACVSGRQGISPLFFKSLPAIQPTPRERKMGVLDVEKRTRQKYLCGTCTHYAPRELRLNSSRLSCFCIQYSN